MSDRLAALGWDPALGDALAPDQTPARVVAAHGALVALDGDRLAPMRGSLRQTGPPVVGDWVAVDEQGAVAGVLPRRGVLRRANDDGDEEVLAAHVDVLLIASSLNRDLSLRRLERFLSLGEMPAAVLLTKADLVADPFAEAARVSRAVGADTVPLSVHDEWGLNDVQALLAPARTAALVGTSGVGKSTLVNALLGEERQQTLPIRAYDDRGRHATTRRELFVLPGGALLVDTPGVKLPRLAGTEGLEGAFADIDALAHECHFDDCTHVSEPGCAVLAAIGSGELDADRLEAMRKLEREARWAEERQDVVTRRARSRAWTREYKEVMSRKPR